MFSFDWQRWIPNRESAHLLKTLFFSNLERRFVALKLLNKMDKSSIKETNMSSEEILKALDRFGNGSKTPSPVEEDRGRRYNF